MPVFMSCHLYWWWLSVTQLSLTHLCFHKQPLSQTPVRNLSSWSLVLLFLWSVVSCLSRMSKCLLTSVQESHITLDTPPVYRPITLALSFILSLTTRPQVPYCSSLSIGFLLPVLTFPGVYFLSYTFINLSLFMNNKFSLPLNELTFK